MAFDENIQGGPSVLPAVRRAMRKRLEPSARQATLEILGLFASDEDLPVIVALLDNPLLAETAERQLLVRYGKRAVPPVVDLLTHSDARVRVRAIGLLGRIGNLSDLGKLRRCLTDDDQRVRTAASRLLEWWEVEPMERFRERRN